MTGTRLWILIAAIVVTIIISFFIFILKIKTRDKVSPFQERLELRVEKAKNKLINKKLNFIEDIISKDSFNLNGYSSQLILYVFSGQDCSSCVSEGFNIIKDINQNFPKKKSFVIAINAEITKARLLYDYDGFIYSDSSNIFYGKLNGLMTPAILLIEDFNIIGLLIPISGIDESKDISAFYRKLE